MREAFKVLRFLFTPIQLNLTAAAVPYLLAASTAVSAYGAISQGKAQSNQAKAQARQAEADARAATIERKRNLIKTLAAQNVGAASQGRTISSIAGIQKEDIRRAGYDESMIQLGGQAQAEGYRNAASSARTSSLISAGSSLLGGAYKHAKTK